MRTSDTIDQILPALLAARRDMNPANKGGFNNFDKYNYANEQNWHEAVMPNLLAHDLTLAFSAPNVLRLENRTTKNGGTEYPVQVHLEARLTHVSGQWLEVDAYGEGQDRGDKGLYKALTGAKKYGYALLFALPTSDDPEADETTGLSEGKATSRQPTKPRATKPQAQTTAAPPKTEPAPKPAATAGPPKTPEDKVAWFKKALADAQGNPAKLKKLGDAINDKHEELTLQGFNELVGLFSQYLVDCDKAVQ